MSSAKNATSSSAPSTRLTWSGKAAGAISSPPRRRSAPTMLPRAIAPICPHDDGAPSAMMAATTASVARARSGSSIAAPQQADGETHLARGRPGQELAERDQIGVALVVEPAPPVHELLAEIAEMRDRSAEGGQPEPQERGQDFTPVSGRPRVSGSGFLARRHPRYRRPNSRSISVSLSST